MSNTDIEEVISIDEKIVKEIQEPPKFKVIFLNDNTTPVEWVVEVLTSIFKHTQETAEKITLTIHEEGSGVAGVYTYEIAEQKMTEATTASRNSGFPLQIRVDKE
jgi:ATP-dependent Clp protease adaptor protein ClpS